MRTKYTTTADFLPTRNSDNKNPVITQLADASKDGCGFTRIELRVCPLNERIFRLDAHSQSNKTGKRTVSTFADIYLGPISRAALVAQLAPDLVKAVRDACDSAPVSARQVLREFLAYIDSIKDPTGTRTAQPIDPLVNRMLNSWEDWKKS